MRDAAAGPKRAYRPNDIALYDDYAAQWWDGSERWIRTLANMAPARLRYFEPIIAGWAGKRVLDLGCAGGFMADRLAESGAQVSGVDPAAKAIAAAQARAAETGRAIDYRVGVGEALPFEDGAFDAVVCVDVLEHVDDLAQVVAEVRRTLVPGGLFLFDTINRTALARLVVVFGAERVLGLLPRGAHDPAKFVRPSELRARLEAEGFDVGRFVGLGPTGVNRRFDFTFGRLPLTAIIYMGSARASG